MLVIYRLELNMELPTNPTGVASSTAEQVRPTATIITVHSMV